MPPQASRACIVLDLQNPCKRCRDHKKGCLNQHLLDEVDTAALPPLPSDPLESALAFRRTPVKRIEPEAPVIRDYRLRLRGPGVRLVLACVRCDLEIIQYACLLYGILERCLPRDVCRTFPRSVTSSLTSILSHDCSAQTKQRGGGLCAALHPRLATVHQQVRFKSRRTKYILHVSCVPAVCLQLAMRSCTRVTTLPPPIPVRTLVHYRYPSFETFGSFQSCLWRLFT